MNKRKVILITGPTCVGKTEYAINMALKNNAIIINSDAFQIYKEIPIITAQPTIKEQKNIEHLLFGFAYGNENFNVFEIIKKIADIVNNTDKDCIIAGGTPMYQYLLLNGISKIPNISAKTKQIVETLTNEEKYEKLKSLDKNTILHKNDIQRITRALEVILETGKSISEWQKKNEKIIYCKIEKMIIFGSKADLRQKTIDRLDNMIKEGCIDEIQELIKKKYNFKNNIFKAHGVMEIVNYLENKCSLEEAKQTTLTRIFQYQKHQITWIKNKFENNS